ncbi:hypothetical protein [Streptosporangium longisporum]|uniref:hypothetical protein n=1 Tax=Streptosporangium longisporum TaxID=46187 RepID=UPI0031ED77A1
MSGHRHVVWCRRFVGQRGKGRRFSKLALSLEAEPRWRCERNTATAAPAPGRG